MCLYTLNESFWTKGELQPPWLHKDAVLSCLKCNFSAELGQTQRKHDIHKPHQISRSSFQFSCELLGQFEAVKTRAGIGSIPCFHRPFIYMEYKLRCVLPVIGGDRRGYRASKNRYSLKKKWVNQECWQAWETKFKEVRVVVYIQHYIERKILDLRSLRRWYLLWDRDR